MAKERIDRDDEDLVRLYLTDIGQYLLLTKDDEVRLAKAIEELVNQKIQKYLLNQYLCLQNLFLLFVLH